MLASEFYGADSTDLIEWSGGLQLLDNGGWMATCQNGQWPLKTTCQAKILLAKSLLSYVLDITMNL